jgi:methionyl aminopeptidase
MILIKNKLAIRKMETAGNFLAEICLEIEKELLVGVSTLHIDTLLSQKLSRYGLVSCTKGYMGYKHSSCISLNDEVVHGVPSEKTKLAYGDLVKVDICASYQGYCADMARCFFVEKKENSSEKLVKTAQESLDAGIAQMKVGARLTNISAAIQQKVEVQGFGVVRDFAGHGIGKRMHEEPEILNYGKPGQGPLLQVGMAFAIEPMITAGSYEVYITGDGWTVKTKDKSLAAHVEDTVVLTDNGPKVLTRLENNGEVGL